MAEETESKMVEQRDAGAAGVSDAGRRRVRVWPAVVILVLELCAIFLPQVLVPATRVQFFGVVFGPILATLAILIWWLTSRAIPWKNRGLVVLALIATLAAIGLTMDQSMGLVVLLYAIPLTKIVWVLLVAMTGAVPWPVRTNIIVAGFLLTLLPVDLFRLEGTDGSMRPQLAGRWQPRPEERVLGDIEEYEESFEPVALPDRDATIVEIAEDDWAEFRGPNRDGRVPGVRIETDWTLASPVELWRRPVGPGWSSFAIVGDMAFTQEQRGKSEAVVCYHGPTGQQIWEHQDEAKFDEAMGGVGPRATPTADGQRIYAMGASGLLNCLDMQTGVSIWRRDVRNDTKAALPQWGFSSSPLLSGDLVVVYAGAPDAGMIAYRRESGEVAWTAPAGTHSYSSPHGVQMGGLSMILMMSDAGLAAVDPASGDLFWRYDWAIVEGARIVQPALVENDEILIGTGYGHGTARIGVEQTEGAWLVREIWKSRALKPYFNDFVVHQGHIYGFDGRILACLDLASGDRLWKGGRYGHGQLLLLEDQDVLLVLSETGAVALVKAAPDGFVELASLQAMEGKTWNHPVVARGKLFVRNAEEAVCYELPRSNTPRLASARNN